MQNELQEAIDIYEEIGLYKKIEEFKERKDEIEITFLKKCEEIKHKLSIQNQILAYLKSLSKVDNYKIILKSVNKIHKLLKDAEPINIDQNVIEKAHQEIERLNS